MSTHTACVSWARGAQPFVDSRYSRAHRWRFDGGVEVLASASPHVVPLPYSNPAGVDPEEAFVAALSSCHLLFFLSLAAEQGFVVDGYVDEASGVLGKDEHGQLMMTRVTLCPKVDFAPGAAPTQAQLEALHHAAHEACFLARSVKTEVRCEPR